MATFNRRDFIKTGGVIAVGWSFLPACSSKMNGKVTYRFFTMDEAMCVIALCEQIIPADDEFGGATDAGVIYYIDRQLMGVFSDQAPTYRESLKRLQTHCNNEHGKPFQDLAFDEQFEIMQRMEKNEIDVDSWANASGFFQLIRVHTMQGYYGSPIHGGNKDYMSFDMLELDYPLIVGQNRYKRPLHEK